MASLHIVCLMIVLISISGTDATSSEDTEGDTCVFGDIEMSEGDEIILDPCTICRCIDSTTICSTRSCIPPGSCSSEELQPVEGKCCSKCPYTMIVQETEISYDSVFDFFEGDSQLVKFGLDVTVQSGKPASKTIVGEDMWKLTAWISPNEDGSGERFSEVDNVFNKEAMDKIYFRKKNRPWTWEDISFEMQFGGGSCDDYRYFCVKFDKGDNPLPKYGLKFSFKVEEDDSNLVDCIPLGNCSEFT